MIRGVNHSEKSRTYFQKSGEIKEIKRNQRNQEKSKKSGEIIRNQSRIRNLVHIF